MTTEPNFLDLNRPVSEWTPEEIHSFAEAVEKHRALWVQTATKNILSLFEKLPRHAQRDVLAKLQTYLAYLEE